MCTLRSLAVLVVVLIDVVISAGFIPQAEEEGEDEHRVQRDAPMAAYRQYQSFVHRGPEALGNPPNPLNPNVRKPQNSPSYYPHVNPNYRPSQSHPYVLPQPTYQHLATPYSPYWYQIFCVPPPVPFVPPEPPLTSAGYKMRTFHTYEEIDPGCEWRIVFKAVEGNGRDVYSDFITPGYLNAHVHGVKQLSSTAPFRDSLTLERWDHLEVDQVKVELYNAGDRKTWFVFDGLGSTLDSWMSKDNLIASPYKDLKTGNFNFFSVTGDETEERRFFISREYNTCANDCGYLAVFDPDDTKACPYEGGTLPRFAYAISTSSCGRFSDEEEVGFADRLVISVKICNSLLLP